MNTRMETITMYWRYWISLLVTFYVGAGIAAADTRPNIVWIVVEDMSDHFHCNGEPLVNTPNVDKLAAEGINFSRAFVTAPVCSAARSALITGMYQTTIGAHHHRSGRGEVKLHLPEHVELVPKLFQDAGYYTVNAAYPWKQKGIGKTDYNFEWDQAVYDGHDWRKRADGQPFFAQVQLRGGKLRNVEKWYDEVKAGLPDLIKAEDVTLPPYYPDDPVFRADWAEYLNVVRYTDLEVGKVIDRLREDGVIENTYIFFLTDHGISHVRGKQFLYEEGIRVPLIVNGPKLPQGVVRDDMVLHLDLAASSLALAGIDIPSWMQAEDILSDDYVPRAFVVSARDRCDETVDRIRCIRTERFKYIRNYYPFRPYLQPCAYKDNKPIQKRMRELATAGKLNPIQALHTAATRPAEELYDLQADPWEVNNLAGNPESAVELLRLRQALDTWIVQTGDQGEQPEPQALFDSDMQAYLHNVRLREEYAETLRQNIALMKLWAKQGR
jgi:arylsulfatase A-like enzyme